MLPTLHPGQIALINKLAYFVRSPGRGDIVCIRTCTGLMVKRIIGLPGEVVSLRQGVLYVDGRRVAETYVVLPNHRELAPGKIPPNSYGVIGDNRSGTVVALVNDNRIVGKLIELDRR